MATVSAATDSTSRARLGHPMVPVEGESNRFMEKRRVVPGDLPPTHTPAGPPPPHNLRGAGCAVGGRVQPDGVTIQPPTPDIYLNRSQLRAGTTVLAGGTSGQRLHALKVVKVTTRDLLVSDVRSGRVLRVRRRAPVCGVREDATYEEIVEGAPSATVAVAAMSLYREDLQRRIDRWVALPSAGVSGVLLSAAPGGPIELLADDNVVELSPSANEVCLVSDPGEIDLGLGFDDSPFSDMRLAEMVLSRPYQMLAQGGSTWRPEKSICRDGRWAGHMASREMHCYARVSSSTSKHAAARACVGGVVGELCQVCRQCPGEVLDHSHVTGIVRGLLCGFCNTHVDSECCGVSGCRVGDYLNCSPVIDLGVRYAGSERNKVRKARMVTQLLGTYPELGRTRGLLKNAGFVGGG